MRIDRIENFTRGWFVGNFEPTIFSTKDFEVGILHHSKGKMPAHYHTSIELNYLISGEMTIHGKKLMPGDIFIIEPYEVVDPVIVKDCTLVVVKTPSMPGDKYGAESPNIPENK